MRLTVRVLVVAVLATVVTAVVWPVGAERIARAGVLAVGAAVIADLVLRWQRSFPGVTTSPFAPPPRRAVPPWRPQGLTDLERDLRLDDHRPAVVQRPGAAVLQQAVRGEKAGHRAVDAEQLLCLRHVEADLPADRLRSLSEDLAPAHQERTGARLDAHGFITILSASRRS